MKYLVLLVSLSFFTACGNMPPDSGELPGDLNSLQLLRKQKRIQLEELDKEIKNIETAIGELDSNRVVNRKLVNTIPVEQKDFYHFVEIQGYVQSDDLVYASGEVGGRIVHLALKEGQYVKRGQLVARLDPESVNKQIQEVEKSMELAKSVFEKQSSLWEQQIGSEIQYLQAKNNKERLEKTLEVLEYQLTKFKIHAPISGIVEKKFLKTGEVAMPGAPIIQILNNKKVKVVADVPENYLKAIKKGEKVSVRFPSLEETYELPVNLVGSSIDPANRTFKIEMNINNHNGYMKPNLLAEVLINDFVLEDVIVVPLSVVQQEISGRSFIYITQKGDEGLYAQKKYVETGKSYANEIVIQSGLDKTMELINEGARNVTERDLIEINNDQSI